MDLNITFFHWIIFGIVLIGIEIVTGTAFVLWIGAAALSVGILNWIIPFSFSVACGIFTGLTLMFLWLGRKMIKTLCTRTDAVAATLNCRGDAMIGRILILSSPIAQGVGKTIVGDSVWTVHGPDLPAGSHVTIIAIEGNALIVTPFHS